MPVFTRFCPHIALLLCFLFFDFFAAAQPTRTWEWVTPIRAEKDLLFSHMAIDAAGNAYVAGWLNGQATFGATVLTSRGWNDLVVAKFDAQGRCLWARQAGPVVASPIQFGPRTYVHGITVDAGGNVYVIGTSKERTLFDNVELAASPDDATYLAKYSPQGDVLWVRQFGFSWPGDVVAAVDGSIYMSHSSPPNAAGYVDGVLVSKLDALGTVLWSRGAWAPAGSTSTGGGVGVYAQLGVGPNQEVYLACNYQRTVSVDVLPGQARTPLPDVASGVFLARYTATGTLDWVRTGYAPGAGVTGVGLVGLDVTGLAVDGAGSAIITGTASHEGAAVFGSLSLPPRGLSDGYLIKYNAQGQPVWGQLGGSTGVDGARNVATDGAGNVYLLANFFKGQASYGGIVLTGGSQYQNVALAKYDPQGNVQWALTQDDGELALQDLAVSPSGDVYVSGPFTAAFRLGAHAVAYASPGTFKRESVVAKLKSPPTLSPPLVVTATQRLIPNIITPNHDGANDEFKLLGYALGEWSCAIYDRWGKRVFYAPHYQHDWQAHGLADGVYFYLVANGSGEMHKGWVEVRR